MCFYNNETGAFGGSPEWYPPNFGVLDSTNVNGDSCDTYGNLFLDPLFVTGAAPEDSLYLSQIASGQSAQSPCVNAGDPTTAMYEGTTRTDSVQDMGFVDIGYHYPNAIQPSPAQIVVFPNPLYFGITQPGQVDSALLHITNPGDSALFLNNIFSNNPNFTLNFSPPDTVFPCDTLDLTIYFAPDSTGFYQGFLTIQSNVDTVQVGLIGGTAPIIAASQDTLNFGAVQYGSSSQLTLVISNQGSLDLVLDSLYTSDPSFTSNFAALNHTIPANGSVNLTVAFAPQLIQMYSETLTLLSNDPVHPSLQVTLLGGSTPAGAVSPLVLNFGPTILDSMETLPVTIRNSGSGGLVINNVYPTHYYYSVAITLPDTIPPLDSLVFPVSFHPLAPGTYNDSLFIITHDTTYIVTLLGNCWQDIAVNEDSLNFGTIAVGETAELPFIIYNPGYAPLQVSTNLISPVFRLSDSLANAIIPALDSLELTAYFSPPVLNASYADTITITSNDPQTPTLLVKLFGTSQAQMVVSPMSLNFGQVQEGSIATRNVTIRNQGVIPLVLNPPTTTNETIFWTNFPSLSPVIPPQDSLVLEVSFSPPEPGIYTDLLTITGSAGTATVNLAGQEAGTIPPGQVSGTWHEEYSPYDVLGDINIPTGDTLTIEPGVTVIFHGHYKLTVSGKLEAQGVADDSIVFTAENSLAGWKGIRFINAQDYSHLAYCVVEYGNVYNPDPNGGGIYCFGNSDPIISNSTVRYCQAYGNGGGICIMQGCNPSLSSVALVQNSAQFGGGFYSQSANPTLTNLDIRDNSAMYGGGMYLHSSTFSLKSSCISLNNATASGGGLNLYNASTTLENCTISRNYAGGTSGSGSGICCSGTSNPIFRNSIIEGNQTHGGLFLGSGSANASLQHCVFYGNVGGNIIGATPSGFGTITTTNANGDPSDANHNIFLDPLFTNAENGLFNLIPESPGIDAGDPAASYKDPALPGSPSLASFPAAGTTTNDMGMYGGPNSANWYNYDHDAGALFITQPRVVDLYTTTIPKAVVYNAGNFTETFQAEMVIGAYSDQASVTLQPGYVDTVEFVGWYAQQTGIFTTQCTVTLVGDQNGSNDTFTGSLRVGPEIASLYPTFGVNQGTATVAIYGQGFVNGIIATLKAVGKPDLVASGAAVQFVSSQEIHATFNLLGASTGWRNLEVANPSGATYTLNSAFQVLSFPGVVLDFGEWETVTSGTIPAFGVMVPDSLENLFILLKKKEQTWSGTITLYDPDSVQIGFESNNNDMDLQIQDALPGFYTMTVTGGNPQGFDIRASGSLDEIDLGSWTLGTVYHSDGFDWKQFSLSEGVTSLQFETQGLGNWTFIDFYQDSLGNPAAHWNFSKWSAGPLTGTINNPPSGQYLVKYSEHSILSGSSQERDYMINVSTQAPPPPPSSSPVIYDLSTYVGGTAGPVTVVIEGAGLDTAAAVFLTRAGEDTVWAEDVVVDTNGTTLGAKFYLFNREPGNWTMQVKNSDSQIAVAPNPFSIQEGGEAQLWLEIVGPEQIRVGWNTNYSIRFGNSGTIDALDPFIYIKVPSTFQYNIDLPFAYPLQDTVYLDTVLIATALIPPGDEKEFEITLSINNLQNGVLEAGFVYNPIYFAQGQSMNIQNPGSSIKYPNIIIFTDNLLPGQLVFRMFGPGQYYPCHVGMYVGEYNGVPSVLEFTIPGQPVGQGTWYVTPFQNWCSPQGIDLYVGCANPPNWTPSIGEQIVFDAIWDFDTGLLNTNYYCVIPEIEGWNNCFSILNPYFLNYGCGWDFPSSTMPVTAYELWTGQISAFWAGYVLENQIAAAIFGTTDPAIWGPMLASLLVNSYLNKSKGLIGQAPGDPEAKYGPGGFDPTGTPLAQRQRFMVNDPNRYFDYRIEIWNKEDATAPVQTAYLRDTLDVDFNDATLSFSEVGFMNQTIPLGGGTYFDFNVTTVEDSTYSFPLTVNLQGLYDPVTRALAFTYTSLDPITMQPPQDPMVGFLPPITSEGTEKAWIEYRLKPKSGLVSGTRLENRAFSNFDNIGGWLGAPDYGPYVNTLDGNDPTSAVNALAATSPEQFPVNCAGSDSTSGVKHFKVYKSVNQGPWSFWKIIEPDSSEIFTGQVDTSYAFYSVAVDWAGNEEVKTPFPESETVVTAGYPEHLGQVVVYPNPYKPNSGLGHESIIFGHPSQADKRLTVPSTVKIYTVAGELVRQLEEPAGDNNDDGVITWDVTNAGGDKVVSGVYLYIISNPQGEEVTGKIAVIR